MFYRDTIVAGKTIIRTLKAVARVNTETQKRRPKTNPTSEAVRRINFRNAVKVLTAKLNHNFKPGDYHLVLTYAEPIDPEEARSCLEKFLNNLRGFCRRRNIDFKWVAVTEYEHTRIHHHVIMSGIDLEEITKRWKYGYVKPTLLDDTGNYYRLAEYLLKETEKTFRNDNSPQKRRYSCSRNVAMPEVKREKIAGREVYHDIHPPKGYSVDEDTVRRYEHAILRVECMEYILVCNDDDQRLKRWKKGRAVTVRESFKDFEKQMSFDDLDI